MTIYRLQIPVTDQADYELTGPVISAAPDRGGRSDVIDIWFEHTGGEPRKRGVYIFGTGHPQPWNQWTRDNWHFIDTVVTPSGLVWHVYVGPAEGEPVYS